MAPVPGKIDWAAFLTFKSEIDRVLLVKHALQKINRQHGSTFNSLKPQQADAVRHLMQGMNVVALLPTGFGKSLIFELLPHLSNRNLVVLVSPLNSLIAQQLQRLAPLACRVKDFVIGSGFSVIIDHPESLLQKTFLDILREVAADRPVFLVVDEAHCVVTWGPNFRKQYANLKHLKAQAPHAVTLALTATATVEMTIEIKKQLVLRSAVVITGNADRTNIKLIVRQRLSNGCRDGVRGSYAALFLPLMDELETQQEMFPKTIIYSPLNWCGQGIQEALRDRRDGSASPIKNFVAQYHRPGTEEAKKRAARAFEHGEARLLFATEAYSMGTDIADIRRVVHAGPPNSLETLNQEIGRAGRDGSPAEAILYYNASDIKANLIHMSDDIRTYCTTKECRRLTLAQYFGFEPEQQSPLHNCCDICTQRCECEQCRAYSGSSASAEPTPLSKALRLYFQCEGDKQLSPQLAASLCLCKTAEELASCLQNNTVDADYCKNITLIMKRFKAITL